MKSILDAAITRIALSCPTLLFWLYFSGKIGRLQCQGIFCLVPLRQFRVGKRIYVSTIKSHSCLPKSVRIRTFKLCFKKEICTLFYCREKFGLHYVDMGNDERPRTPKASSEFYKKIVSDNGFLQDISDSYKV